MVQVHQEARVQWLGNLSLDEVFHEADVFCRGVCRRRALLELLAERGGTRYLGETVGPGLPPSVEQARRISNGFEGWQLSDSRRSEPSEVLMRQLPLGLL